MLYLSRSHHFGPARIAVYLDRYHGVRVSKTGIWRLLKRAGMNRLPTSMWYRARIASSGTRSPFRGTSSRSMSNSWSLCPAGGHYCQYTAIDDRTLIRVLRIYDWNTQRTAIAFVDYAPAKLPFTVQCIQTDNGREFEPQFHWRVLDKGIQHRHIRPRQPYLNGKSERSHRIDEGEFYRQLEVVISTVAEFNQRLQEGEQFYSYHRPHGSLNGQKPYERLLEHLGLERQG